MKLSVIAVGRPGRLLAPAIHEYEERAARYWPLEISELKAERAGKGRPEDDVRRAESERLLARARQGVETVVLTRTGKGWASAGLAHYLQRLAVHGHPGAAFLIGGAYGIAPDVAERATRSVSLSPFTLPHDLARLVLAEQLYRAGTIARGEPYHKGGP